LPKKTITAPRYCKFKVLEFAQTVVKSTLGTMCMCFIVLGTAGLLLCRTMAKLASQLSEKQANTVC